MMDIEMVIENARRQNIGKFVISGAVAEINVFFNMNCLERLFDNYDISKDYRNAFSKVTFYMYQKTESETLDTKLSEVDFISATDDELSVLLNYILSNDEHLKEVYEKIECENVYERFYIANDNLIKDAVKPISDAFKRLNKMFIPQISGIEKVLTQQNAIMKSITMPQVETLNQIASIFAKQAQFAAAQVKTMDFSYLNNLSKFEFPQMQSKLDNIPKFTIDIASIILPFNQQVSQMQENMRRILSNAISSFANSFAGIDFSMLTYHQEWSEKHDFLVGCGWFYLNELPKDVIDSIYERRDNITPNEVDEIVSHHFRQNRCYELKRIIRKWGSSIYFKPRERIFHEALVNHSRKYYNSSTTLLVLHTEGVITDFVRIKLQIPRFKAHRAITDITDCLGDIPMKMLSLSDWKIYNCVFERILDSFQEGFSHANPDNASNHSRDKIAHGHAVERETEVSSLKQFLYLNEVYRLFTLFDEKVFKQNDILESSSDCHAHREKADE